ncbi:hypothetical protein O4J55_24830 [Paracoccus sp. PXZ]
MSPARVNVRQAAFYGHVQGRKAFFTLLDQPNTFPQNLALGPVAACFHEALNV